MKYLLIFFHYVIFSQEISYTYNNVEKSDTLVVILPGLGFSNVETDKNTTLNEFLSSDCNTSTLIINVSKNLYLDSDTYLSLDNVIQKYSKNKKIIIGGFSIGGNLAINYYNYKLNENNSNHIIGIFLVDSPIDLEFLLNNCQKKKEEKNFKRDEEKMLFKVLNYYKEKYGEDFFINNSPIQISNLNESIKKFHNINILIFSKPNNKWNKKFRGYNKEEINYFVLKKFYESVVKVNKNIIFYDKYKEDLKNPHNINIINNYIFKNWL